MPPLRQTTIHSLFLPSSDSSPSTQRTQPKSRPAQGSSPQHAIEVDDSDSDVAVLPNWPTPSQSPDATALTTNAPELPPSPVSRSRGSEGRQSSAEYGWDNEDVSDDERIEDVRLSPTQTQMWRGPKRRVICDDSESEEDIQPTTNGRATASLCADKTESLPLSSRPAFNIITLPQLNEPASDSEPSARATTENFRSQTSNPATSRQSQSRQTRSSGMPRSRRMPTSSPHPEDSVGDAMENDTRSKSAATRRRSIHRLSRSPSKPGMASPAMRSRRGGVATRSCAKSDDALEESDDSVEVIYSSRTRKPPVTYNRRTRITSATGRKRKAPNSADGYDTTPPSTPRKSRGANARSRIVPVRRNGRKQARVDSDSEPAVTSDDTSPKPAATRGRSRHKAAKRKALSSTSGSDTGPPTTRSTRARPRSAASKAKHQIQSDSESPSSVGPSTPKPPMETPAKRRLRRMRMGRLGQVMSQSEQESDIAAPFINDNDSSAPPSPIPTSARRKQLVDPDEETDQGAMTEVEGIDEIELDQPERFQTTTRLRQRQETKQQRFLRKLINRRNNVASSGSEDGDHDEGSDGDDDKPRGEDEDDGSQTEPAPASEMGSFISDDESEIGKTQLPDQFSLGYAQATEYKFKILFQYILLLVISGPSIFPLNRKQKEYLKPADDLIQHMKNLRDLRVRGQIWKRELIHAMEKYPTFEVTALGEREPFCDACNRRNQHCYHMVNLTGEPYDPKTHEPVENTSESESSEEESDEEVYKLPKDLFMGSYCLKSARMYHCVSHWEHEIFLRIRGMYREILRAKGIEFSDDEDDHGSDMRSRYLARQELPDENDVNLVLEWMEGQGYVNQAYEKYIELETAVRKLGGDDVVRESREDEKNARPASSIRVSLW